MNFFLTEWFYYLLKWLHDLLSNSYVLTIVIATLLLRLVQIYPDIKNRKTQIKNAAIQPELQELQKRYANDQQKLVAEQRKLMKKHGVSMWSSCLPLLITLPLFFCFLDAFRCWGNEESVILMYETAVAVETEDTADDEAAMDTYKSFRFLWVYNVWQPDSMFEPVIPRTTSLVTSTLASDKLASMPLLEKGYTNAAGEFVSGQQIWETLTRTGLATGDYLDKGDPSACSACSTNRDGMALIPDEVTFDGATYTMIFGSLEGATAVEGEEDLYSTTGAAVYDRLMQRYVDESATKDGDPSANGLFILPILAAGMQLLSMFLSQRRNKGNQTEQTKQMRWMMYIMPLISVWVCLSSTSAFAFYWTVSGVIQLISTLIINFIFDRKAKKQEVLG